MTTIVTIWRDGKEIGVPLSSLELPTKPLAIDLSPKRIFKASVWKRCTDAEYAALRQVIDALDARTKAIFNDANYIDIRDELYPLVLQGATAVLGETRALELLEPEE